MRRTCASAAAALLALALTTAALAETTARLGGLTFGYDAGHWRLERPAADTMAFRSDKETVEVRRQTAADESACAAATDTLLPSVVYPRPSVIDTVPFGGLTATRSVAHTGCRNATAPGIAICAFHRGHIYTVQSIVPGQGGCRGSLPFRDFKWFDELLKQARFD